MSALGLSAPVLSRDHREMTLKVALIGAGGVGKTSLLRSWRGQEVAGQYIPTMGVEVHPLKRTYTDPDGPTLDVTWNVWDCAGQEKYRGLREAYYIGAHAIILVYDPNQPFEKNNEYLKEIAMTAPKAKIMVCAIRAKKDSKIPFSHLRVLSEDRDDDPFLPLIRSLCHPNLKPA